MEVESDNILLVLFNFEFTSAVLAASSTSVLVIELQPHDQSSGSRLCAT
jgi:hypothetical protein